MMRRLITMVATCGLLTLGAVAPLPAVSQADGPEMLHPRLDVRTVVEGLVTPTSMAFLGAA